jgi:hypothetical protein
VDSAKAPRKIVKAQLHIGFRDPFIENESSIFLNTGTNSIWIWADEPVSILAKVRKSHIHPVL